MRDDETTRRGVLAAVGAALTAGCASPDADAATATSSPTVDAGVEGIDWEVTGVAVETQVDAVGVSAIVHNNDGFSARGFRAAVGVYAADGAAIREGVVEGSVGGGDHTRVGKWWPASDAEIAAAELPRFKITEETYG